MLASSSLSFAGAAPPSFTSQRATALSMQAKLDTLPFVKRPAYLDGTLAADQGLDPLGFVTKYSDFSISVPALRTNEVAPTKEYENLKTVKKQEFYGYKIALSAGTKDPQRSLMWMREAEVKHARLAMLAAAGWPLAELWHGPFSKLLGAPYELDVTQGRSLSVLNGGLDEVAPFLFLVALACSVVECKTLDNVYGLTATGKTMKPNGQLVMKSYVPGDCGFDPLNLYGYFGQNVGVMEKMRGDTDPAYAFELAEEARRQMETTELKNGR